MLKHFVPGKLLVGRTDSMESNSVRYVLQKNYDPRLESQNATLHCDYF